MNLCYGNAMRAYRTKVTLGRVRGIRQLMWEHSDGCLSSISLNVGLVCKDTHLWSLNQKLLRQWRFLLRKKKKESVQLKQLKMQAWTFRAFYWWEFLVEAIRLMQRLVTLQAASLLKIHAAQQLHGVHVGDLERGTRPHSHCDANAEGGSDSGKERRA